MSHAKRSRPAERMGGTGPATNVALRFNSSIPAEQTKSSDISASFRGCYAVLVHGKRVRRHLYFNLPAASNAVRRAHSKGYAADMILVQLVPVDSRQLDQVNEVINNE